MPTTYPKLKATPRRVDLLNNPADFQCVALGAQGFSTKFLSERTGLTPCQVTYRLHAASIRRCDYRNGHSAVAKALLKTTQDTVDALMTKHIKHQLAEFNAARKIPT